MIIQSQENVDIDEAEEDNLILTDDFMSEIRNYDGENDEVIDVTNDNEGYIKEMDAEMVSGTITGIVYQFQEMNRKPGRRKSKNPKGKMICQMHNVSKMSQNYSIYCDGLTQSDNVVGGNQSEEEILESEEEMICFLCQHHFSTKTKKNLHICQPIRDTKDKLVYSLKLCQNVGGLG